MKHSELMEFGAAMAAFVALAAFFEPVEIFAWAAIELKYLASVILP